MVRKSDYEIAPAPEKEPNHKPRMVPIISWRTLIFVAVGFIVGAGLGLLYWIISPSLSNIGNTDGFSSWFAQVDNTSDYPWSSTVSVQIVNPGSSYMSLSSLQNKGEYYTAKFNSLPFLEFLSQELEEQAPEYSHTPDELNQILTVGYSSVLASYTYTDTIESMSPSIDVTATCDTGEEAVFIAELVPQAFENYLLAEESDEREKERQYILDEIESVKSALYESEIEFSTMTPQGLQNDPTYMALSITIEALEEKLEEQAAELTVLITSGSSTDIDQEYSSTLQKIQTTKVELVQAEKELWDFEEDSEDALSNAIEKNILNAKITALESELDKLMGGWTETSSTGVITTHEGLAQMIADGDTSSLLYSQRLEMVETTSTAIIEAQRQLEILENGSSGDLSTNTDYLIAQIKVDSLNMQLSTLEEKLYLLAEQLGTDGQQEDAQIALERTATALNEAETELRELENAFYSLGGYSLEDLDYQSTETRIEYLSGRLETLNERLSSLVGENAEPSEIAGYFVAGNPSMPLPDLPQRVKMRNVLIIGAVLGIVVAWIILNFKWILKGMPREIASRREEDEEDYE